MVKTDIRDDGQYRHDDVGAVEPTAEPHFNDGYIHLRVGKILECHGGRQFEKAGMQRFKEGTVRLYKINDIRFFHTPSINLYSLPEIYEVRTCIQTYLIACRLKDCGQSVRTRTFAVCSRNVNRFVFPMGMTEKLVQRPGVVQPLLISRSTHMLEDRGALKQILNCFLV